MAAACTVEEAVAALRRGGVIAYPTEAVWGLGCDPRDEAATLRRNGHVAQADMLARFVVMPTEASSATSPVRQLTPKGRS